MLGSALFRLTYFAAGLADLDPKYEPYTRVLRKTAGGALLNVKGYVPYPAVALCWSDAF